MKKTYYYLAGLTAVLPFLASAQDSSTLGSAAGNSCEPGKLCNPLKDTGFGGEGVVGFFTALYENILVILVPLIVLAIIWAGFQFVVAQGNESKLTAAKTTLKNVLIGSVIILVAGALFQVLGGTIASLIS